MKFASQAEAKRTLQVSIKNNPRAALKALLMVYSRQTDNEKASCSTVELNGVGFSGCDAEILTSFVQQVREGRTLSSKQMAVVHRRMPHYWKQLAVMSGGL